VVKVGIISGVISNTGKTTIAISVAMYVTSILRRRLVYVDLDWVNQTGSRIIRSQFVKIEKGLYRLEPPDTSKLPVRGFFDVLCGGKLDPADLYATRIIEKGSPILLIGPGGEFREPNPEYVEHVFNSLNIDIIFDFPVLETEKLLKIRPILEKLDLIIFPTIPGKEELTNQEVIKLRQLCDASIILVHNMVTKEPVKGREKIPEIRLEAKNLEEKIYNIARRIFRKHLNWLRTYIH